MTDKIKTTPCVIGTDFTDNPQVWLAAKAKELQSGKIYLLSFHDDGVIWGKIENDLLTTSGDYDAAGKPKLADTPSPKFRVETLQECRLFGKAGELFIWRVGENQFAARTALESELKIFDSLDERQVLWGRIAESGDSKFTVVSDGEEGLCHAFPQPLTDEKFISDKKLTDKSEKNRRRPLRLCVKHYIEYDGDGCARIAFSRLTDVSVE